MTTRPNVLVLVLDSVRARNVSLYGYTHATTPFLEELGRTGTTYRFAYAPSTTSISSHVSLFTGRHEDEHRIYGPERRFAPSESVWTRLREDHDYATGLFTINPQFHRDVGLTSGFDRTVLAADDTRDLPYPGATDPLTLDPPEWFPLSKSAYRAVGALAEPDPLRTVANGVARVRGMDDPASTYVVDDLLDWVDSIDGQWAAFANLMDAHAPYEPRPEHNRWADDDLFGVQDAAGGGHYRTMLGEFAAGNWWRPSALEHLYDGAIRQADAMVRRVVTALRERDAFEDTLLVVTADHGEGFGEPSRLYPDHHVFAHSAGVHEVQTHVPLVVSPPGPSRRTDAARVDEPASLTRLPAVLERTVSEGFDPGSFLGADGRVLVSRGADENDRYLLNDGYPAGKRERLPERAYAAYERVDGRLTKFCRSGDHAATVRVFDAQESARVEGSEPGIDAWFPGPTTDAGITDGDDSRLDEAARERLEQFGYLG